MLRTITALFEDAGRAERARQDLIAYGVDPDRVSILRQEVGGQSGIGQRSFVSALSDLFLPEDDERTYGDALDRGGVMLCTRVAEGSVDEAIRVIEAAGPADVEAGAATPGGRPGSEASAGLRGQESAVGTGVGTLNNTPSGLTPGRSAGPGSSAGLAAGVDVGDPLGAGLAAGAALDMTNTGAAPGMGGLAEGTHDFGTGDLRASERSLADEGSSARPVEGDRRAEERAGAPGVNETGANRYRRDLSRAGRVRAYHNDPEPC